MISPSSRTERPRFSTRSSVYLAAALLVTATLVGSPQTGLAQAAPSAEQSKEAVIVSKQALDYYYKGRHEMAAELYRRAWELDPSRPEYGYGAARAEHKRGQLKVAIGLYEKVIKQAGPRHQMTIKSTHHLATARAALAAAGKGEPAGPTAKPEKPAPAAVAKPPQTGKKAPAKPATGARPAPVTDAGVSQKADAGWRPTAGWSAVGGGALLTTVGVVILLGAVADNDDLDALFDKHSAGNPIADKTYDEAVQERESANNRTMLGWGLTGVGVVAAGAGAWLLSTADSAGKTALLPQANGRGLRLCMRF